MLHAETSLAALQKVEDLLFLQLAMQHFVVLQVAKMGQHGQFFFATCSATFVGLQVVGKTASCNMALRLRLQQR